MLCTDPVAVSIRGNTSLGYGISDREVGVFVCQKVAREEVGAFQDASHLEFNLHALSLDQKVNVPCSVNTWSKLLQSVLVIAH